MYYICITSIPAGIVCSAFEAQFDENDRAVQGWELKQDAEAMLKYYEQEYDATGYVWERKNRN